MVRGLNSSGDSEMGWLGDFAIGKVLGDVHDHLLTTLNSDFRSRFLTLLSFPHFRQFGSATALSILEAVNNYRGVKELDVKGDAKSMPIAYILLRRV